MTSADAESFTPSRLSLARERAAMTQRRLAERIGVSDRMVKAYESGEKSPSRQTLCAISDALGFPQGFFLSPAIDPLSLEAASFRALTKASGALRRSVVAAGTIAIEVHDYLCERFDLPQPNVPDLRDADPPRAAAALRHLWGLGQIPIGNIVHLVELHGVRVFSLSEDCEAIDAFSLWRDGTPFMFLNTRKTAERGIFDVAHELGHLVLHRHGTPQGQQAERDADLFAANFLLPEQAIRASAPRLATISSLIAMKRRWRVSVAALGFRLHELGLMSDWHYRQFNIELSRRGKANEPSPLPRQTSAVLRKALATLSSEGIGLRELARELYLPVSEISSLTFGLAVIGGGGDGTGAPGRRGSLRPI